ncbi:MAG: DUF389 domain-containing protein [Acutalibacteraceae bacterium]
MKTKIKKAFSLHGDTADHLEIRKRIINSGQVTGTNLCILMMAILIASIGLNMNSTAVIIGAMLISPIMGSIQAMSYGAATGDTGLLEKSGMGFLFQIAVSIVTSTIYFWISPISTQTSELLARTQPNIWDVMIAFCGGIAGMIGITRTEKSNVIPGVAIATALMPPLCTCGYAIANGSLRIALGAGYLFLVNSYFIFLSSVLVLIALKVPKKSVLSEQQRSKVKRRLILNTVIILIPCIVVAGFMVQQANTNSESVTGFEETVSVREISSEIKILFPEVKDVKIGTLDSVDKNGETISQTNAVIYLQKELNSEDTSRLEQWIEKRYGKSCCVIFITEN